MQIEKLRSLIRESINEYIKEIDEAGTRAMYEAKMKACDEAMDARKKKIEMAESLEEMQGMFDETKMGDLKKEIKMLEKQKAKYGKMLEKMNKGKEVVTEEPVEEAPVDEADVTAEMSIDEAKKKDKKEEDKKDKKEKEKVTESYLKMQKLAGVITESQYNSKKKALIEAKIPSFRIKQVLTPFGMDKPEIQADLRVGLGYVIPKKNYSDMNDIQQHMGKVTKIEGDKVFLETPKGEQQYKISDLAYISNAAS